MTKFNMGDEVVDRDGFRGRVVKVTQHEGNTWYDIRFANGEAVRYDSDLKIVSE